LRHVLYGEFELTIDDKNRLFLPSEVRKQINPETDGDAFFAILGTNHKLWLYPDKYYQQLANQQPSDDIPAEDLLAYDLMKFSLASKLEWDKQGRMLIPEKVMKRYGLSKDVTLIGVRDHLQLWNTPDWAAYRESLLARSSEVTLRAKQARLSPPSQPPQG